MTTEGSVYRLPAEIRQVDVDRSGQWLAAGWRDFRRTPVVSLVYGGAFVVISLLLTFGLMWADLDSLILPLAGGFIILSPILVVGLYDVSKRLEKGREVSLRHVFKAFSESIGQLSAMGVVLLICYLVWIEVALFLFMIFFNQAPPPLDRFFEDVLFSLQGAPLLIVGTIVGGIFAAVVFTVTAVSIPMIYDRPIDVVSAIGTSIVAVRENWQPMFGWAALIAVVSFCGLASFFLGLAVAIPVLAYATWHAYRDLVGESVDDLPGSTAEGHGAGI